MKTPLIVGAGLSLILVATALAYVVASRDGDNDPASPATPTAAADTPTTTPIPVVFEPYNQRAMAGVGWDPGPKPPSPFPTWHGTEAVIYDTQTMSAIDLGEGASVTFSDDGKYAAWLAGPLELNTSLIPGFIARGGAWIITLANGERRDIGPASAVTFVEGDRVALAAPRTPLENVQWTLYDISTLQRSADQTTAGDRPEGRQTSTGHILKGTPITGTELPRGGYATGNFELLDPADRHVVLAFDAFAVASADATHLVVARAPGDFPKGPFESIHVQIYLLDVTTGEGSWIGAAAASSPNWNLSANEHYVLWTNNYCAETESGPEVILLDRQGLAHGYSGGVDHPLPPGGDDAWMVLAPNGLIAQGTFGATALLDPGTGKYVVTLPPIDLAPGVTGSSPQARWSKDYRYATYYFAGGHGGLC
jgi:hypothetical protein